MVPLAFVGSLWVMAGFLLLGGMAIAPTLIATLAVTERSVPKSRLTEGMAILHTGMGVGIAPGAALGGLMIDAYGASPAYAVPASPACSGRRPPGDPCLSSLHPMSTPAWSNWSGLATASPSRVLTPRDAGEVASAVTEAASRGGTVKMVGTGHSFTAIAARRRRAAAPGRAARHHRGRPRRDDRDRPGRHAAARAQRRAGPGRAVACTTWATSTSRPSPAPLAPAPTAPAGVAAVAGRPGRRARAGHRHGELLRATPDENADVFDVGPGRPRGARGAHLGDLPGRAAVRCSRPTSGRWPGTRRSAAYDELVAANHHVDMYWFPHTDRVLVKTNNRLDADLVRGRAAVAVAGLARRRAALQHRLRRARTRSATASPRSCRGSTGSPAGAVRAPLLRRRRTGSSPPARGWSSGRWSTPSRARPG